jgi:hypothetical protein
VNVTVVSPTGSGFLTFYPDAGPSPLESTINFGPGQTRANNAIVALDSAGNGTAQVRPSIQGNSGQVHLVVDVNGYFED